MFILLKEKGTGIKTVYNTRYIVKFTVEGASIFAHLPDNLTMEYEGDFIKLMAQLEAGKEAFRINKEEDKQFDKFNKV